MLYSSRDGLYHCMHRSLSAMASNVFVLDRTELMDCGLVAIISFEASGATSDGGHRLPEYVVLMTGITPACKLSVVAGNCSVNGG